MFQTQSRSTGKERDTESGNDYFGARYYASSMGRFMSPDSVGGSPDDPQSWNLYSYVLNNPLKNTDPDGHSVQICDNNGHCRTVDDDVYKAAQQASSGSLNGPSLASLQNSATGTGTLTSTSTDANGNTTTSAVGTVKWTADNPGIQGPAAMAGFNQLSNTSRVVQAGVAVYAGVYGGLAVAATAPGAAVAVGRWGLQRLAIGASSPVLLNLVNRLYQAQDEIPGGTAGAIRNEVMTGEYINGNGHVEKAIATINALQDLIRSGELNGSDQTIAGHLLSDLRNAVGRSQ